MNSEKQTNIAINDLFVWLQNTTSEGSALHTAAKNYLSEASRDTEYTDDGPFLSIVMRTQGKRPEMLSEVLLCLFGQSNTDFELLLMGHNLNDTQHETVTRILAEQPEPLRCKTRLIPVNGGTRTTPLNRGFEEAKGRYIAVLDDDDLVFENWVEAFYELSKENNGKILHAYAVKQDWQTVGEVLPDTPCAVGKPDDCYCVNFNYLKQLSLNFCPLCTLAFPSYLFKKLGIKFDETLSTTEDWDYLMRVAFLAGVADNPKITFLYRIWTNAENSATLHNKDEWDKNYRKIVEQLVDTPIVMPRQSFKGVIDTEIPYLEANERTCTGLLLREGELYYDIGAGFAADRVLSPVRSEMEASQSCTACFTDSELSEHAVKAIRFDPCNDGLITLHKLKIDVVESDGTVTAYGLDDVEVSGRRVENRALFLLDDPQIQIHFEEPKQISRISVYCYFETQISNDDRAALIATKPSLAYRGLRKIKNILFGLIRK